MTVAFVCPDSFTDYEAVEKELLKNEGISSIVCATTNAYNLIEVFSLKFDIKHKLIKSPGNEARLRKIVETSDKVVLFEYSDYDSKKVKYSRTQYALGYTKKLNHNLQYIDYDRDK